MVKYWNDIKTGCGGFSTSEEEEELQNSVFAGKRNNNSLFDDGWLEVDFKKRVRPVESNDNQQQQNVYMGSSPLGLSLRKTSSFAELIEMKLLAQQGKTSPTTKIGNQSTGARHKKEAEKLKAGSWNAKYLRIGSWERRATRDLDLVAKCYYAKRKLVWEMLDDGLKSKIEVQWLDINAIRATFPKNQNAVLEIELKNAPLFFRETNPQPRKHTIWQPSGDFTGGQALQYRRHYLEFEEGTLGLHYEKLLQCDKRLFMLSQQPFPMDGFSRFQLNMLDFPDFSFEFNRPQPEFAPMLQFAQYGAQRPAYVSFHQQPQMLEATPRPTIINYPDLASPMSVMEFSPVEDHSVHLNIDHQRTLIGTETETMHGKTNYMGIGNQVQHFEFSTPPHQVTPLLLQPVAFQYPSSSGAVLPRPPSTNSLLKDLAQKLDDPVTSSFTNEEMIMAKVNSMYNLIELSPEQGPSNNTDASDMDYGNCTDNSTLSWSTCESNGNEGLINQESVNWSPTVGSNENMFMQHRRIPSFSNLFFDEALEEFATGRSGNN